MRATSPTAAEKALKARCRTDRRLFARYFLHEKLEKPFSRFHLAALEAPKQGFRERPPMGGWRRARMGPRGNGKTTVYVRVEVVHDVAYRIEEFVAIIAEALTLSRSRLREIRLELEQNERIRHFFGDLVGSAVWRVDDLETANGVRIVAKAMSSQVRGIVHPVTNARPTKIILDDAEDAKDVLNPELRERDRRTFTEDIEGSASVDGRTCIQFTGTPLHREALLPGLRENPGWDFQAFPAIEVWPERMDLWERCRELWAAAGAFDPEDASANGQATAVAREFYEAHRFEMDRGARVLWPEGEPLFALMVWRWTNGEAAFSKEKLLVPRDPALSTFDMARALRHEVRRNTLVIDQRGGGVRRLELSRLRFVAWHDPAKADPSATRSRTSLGDYAAIVVMGIEDLQGGGRIGHVVHAWMERKPPSVQIETAFEIAEMWKAALVVEEDTYGLLSSDYKRVARERRASGRFWQLDLKKCEHQETKKDVRISSLEPAVANGWMTFNRALPAAFLHQFEDHPTGDHDDGPDATEGCWRMAKRKQPGLATVDLSA